MVAGRADEGRLELDHACMQKTTTNHATREAAMAAHAQAPVMQNVERVASEVVARSVAAVGLAGIAVIHLLDSISTFPQTPYIGWLYVGLMLSTLTAAGALVRSNLREAWVAAVVLPALAIVAYVLTRTSGLPQDTGDVGNWADPLGLAALFTESAVIAIAGYALSALEPVRAMPRRVRRVLATLSESSG
jgi:hypothetical protein